MSHRERLLGALAAVLSAACAATTAFGGAATLTFTAPAVATPPPITVQPGNVTVIADTLSLITHDTWDGFLNTVLVDQGFTSEYGWIYDSTTPVVLGNTAVYNCTQYSTAVTPAVTGGTVSEPCRVTLGFGNTVQPAGATLHWLSILHEDKQYGTGETGGTPFGYAISGYPGYWGCDNGDVANMGTGIAPYYDSNGGNPMYVPPLFYDNPTVGKAIVGTYLHFYTIPVWDVLEGSQHMMELGDQGFKWGYAVVPEPSGLFFLIPASALLTRKRR